MAANVQQYIFAGARVKVTGSSTSRSRIDTKILAYDEPAKKLLAVTAKSISVAAAGAPSLTAGKEDADRRAALQKLLEARDARAVQQEKAAADKHARQLPSSGQEGALLPRRSERQMRPPPSSPSEA